MNKKRYISMCIFVIMHIILHNEWRKIEIDRNKKFLSGIWTRITFVHYVILTSLKMVNVGEWSDVELELGKDSSKMVFVWCLKRVRRLLTHWKRATKVPLFLDRILATFQKYFSRFKLHGPTKLLYKFWYIYIPSSYTIHI